MVPFVKRGIPSLSLQVAQNVTVSRRTIRLLAVAVLVLFGAPVVMHVVLHDLHHHEGRSTERAHIETSEHGAHEHPVIGSADSSSRVHAPASEIAEFVVIPAPVLRLTARDHVSVGALRLDVDIGVQRLLSTFLI